MRVEIIADRCHGHQSCAIAAPDIFGSDDLGNAVVFIDGDVPEDQVAKVRRAAGNCPEQAVLIIELPVQNDPS